MRFCTALLFAPSALAGVSWNRLEVNLPRTREVISYSLCLQNPFSQTLHFMGEQANV